MKIVALAAVLLAFLPGSAFAATDHCRHVTVAGEEGDGPLSGIEDLVYHPPSATLILSVHDRWKDQKGDSTAVMGLFGARVADLFSKQPVQAKRLAGSSKAPMRPHGIALRMFAGGIWRLLVIDHRYHQEEEREGKPGTVIHDFTVVPDGTLKPEATFGHRDLCPANDLDWLDDRTAAVTLDRANCGGFWRFLELSRAQSRGRLVQIPIGSNTTGSEILGELGFPNGVATGDGGLWMTTTRGKGLEFVTTDDTGRPDRRLIDAQSGADNLSVAPDGSLLTALHPSTFTFGMYAMQIPGFTSTPTLMVRYPAVGEGRGPVTRTEPEIILDDPDGDLISGATSVIQVGDHYIAGAAFDTGLVVCDVK